MRRLSGLGNRLETVREALKQATQKNAGDAELEGLRKVIEELRSDLASAEGSAYTDIW